jgi:oligosaccharide repeat unit polymerase
MYFTPDLALIRSAPTAAEAIPTKTDGSYSFKMNETASRRAGSTATILCGILATYIATQLFVDDAVQLFSVAAYGVAVTLALSTYIEGKGGARELIRVDILLLWVLYGLTLFEFLFPQPNVDVSLSNAANGADAVLLGVAGIAVGRHLISHQRSTPQFPELRPSHIFLLFVLAAVLGNFYPLLSVNFDPFELLRQMSLPRFTQSWSRGRYGDAWAVLSELGLLGSLIPPVAGLIFAQAERYSLGRKLFVVTVLLFTVYGAIASGTRSALGTLVVTFLGSYFLAKPSIKLRRVLVLGALALAFVVIISTYMLEIRTTGLGNLSFSDKPLDSMFVDLNIVNISNLTAVFPDLYGYLGLEVPFNALIRPIPRFLWPDKPEGLSVTIESALGAGSYMTLSCTFIGEAYMSGGFFGVAMLSILFGAAAEAWNRIGRNVNSQFAQVLYASGFLCAAVGMRSMLSMAPLALPTIALWLFGKLRRDAAKRSAKTGVR